MGRHACEAPGPDALAAILVNRLINGADESDAAITVFGRTMLLQPRHAFDGLNAPAFRENDSYAMYVSLPIGPKFNKKRHLKYDAAYIGSLDLKSGVVRSATSTAGIVKTELASSRAQDFFNQLPFEIQFGVVKNTVLSLIDASENTVVTLLNNEGDLTISTRWSSSGPFRFSDNNFIDETGIVRSALEKLAFNELCYLETVMLDG